MWYKRGMPNRSNRRDFLRNTLSVGAGLVATNALARDHHETTRPAPGDANVALLTTEPTDRVRLGVIGLGNRGASMLPGILQLDWVDVTAVCDKVDAKLERASDIAQEARGERPQTFGGVDGWKQLCAADSCDAVYICTPWDQHTPQALAAMTGGKHALVEVPAALTVDEAWQLVETSETTRRHCAMMENCCYGNSELTALNMAKQGVLGTLVHGAGAYIHDLRDLHFSPDYYEDQWRLKFCEAFNCNHYPTHGLGPVAWYMDINRGDAFDYMVTVASMQAGMSEYAAERFGDDSPQAKQSYALGDMNTSILKTKRGRTILVQHDVTSPRPYSRINQISGTKGTFEGYPDRLALSPDGHRWLDDDALRSKMSEYEHPLWAKVGAFAREVGGHGGMDFVMMYRTLDCLRRGVPLDFNAYDAAAWSVLFPLSARSMGQRGGSVDIPDFTRGAWQTTPPLEIGA